LNNNLTGNSLVHCVKVCEEQQGYMVISLMCRS
jgi:hypothetical protein